MQEAKDPLMSPHAQHFHNARTSWVRREKASTPSVGPNNLYVLMGRKATKQTNKKQTAVKTNDTV
jgi:hypothetical protein